MKFSHRKYVTHCLDIFGCVRMYMSNCLFNTFNYFCNTIISEVICSFCGLPWREEYSLLCLNFSVELFPITTPCRESREANYNYRYEKSTIIANAKQDYLYSQFHYQGNTLCFTERQRQSNECFKNVDMWIRHFYFEGFYMIKTYFAF